MQIIYLLLFILILTLTWILRTSIPYSDITLNSFDQFFYTLKYRGIADESIIQNARISIFEPKIGNVVGLVKYKESGKVGFYFGVTVSNLLEKEKVFIKMINKYKLNFYIMKKGIFNEVHYYIDIDLNLNLFKDLLTFVWFEIYEADLVFELYFQENFCKKPGKIIDFKDTKELEEKGINIDIPITKWQWLIYKLKGKRTHS